MKKFSLFFAFIVLSSSFTFASQEVDQGNNLYSFTPPLSEKESLSLNSDEIYTCPRCRRAAPKGPRKLPSPPFGDHSSKNSK